VKHNQTTVIGTTKDGKMFRPTNWHVRLAGIAASFINGRMVYHKHVTPYCIIEENISAVLLDDQLKIDNPTLYDFIISFATDNNLIIKYAEPKEIKEDYKAAKINEIPDESLEQVKNAAKVA